MYKLNEAAVMRLFFALSDLSDDEAKWTMKFEKAGRSCNYDAKKLNLYQRCRLSFYQGLYNVDPHVISEKLKTGVQRVEDLRKAGFIEFN